MAQSTQNEVVLKIGGEVENESQSSDPTRRWNKEFSDAKTGQQSSYSSCGGGGIGKCGEDDDDDDDEGTECRSNGFYPQNSMMFTSRMKSRLEDRHWRYERGAKTGNKEEDDDSFLDEDVHEEIQCKKFRALTVVQWVSLMVITATLAFTLSVAEFKKRTLWHLPLWKWEILILVLICGHLVSGWVIRLVVFSIETNFIWKIRVLYFVYGLRKSIQNCLWVGLVTIVWRYILADKIWRENTTLRYVTRILVCLLVGSLVWLLKTIIVKVLASSFHMSAFFNRIRDSLFKQYAIKKLSGVPIVREESEQEQERVMAELKKNPKLSLRAFKRQDQILTIERLNRLNQKTVSAKRMKRLISIVQRGVLTTLDEDLPKSTDEDESALRIRDECEAKAAAKKIFQKVASGSK